MPAVMVAEPPILKPAETVHELPSYARDILFDYHFVKVAYGGRGSTKTWTFAACAMIKANEQKLRIACLREYQKSLEESNKETLQLMGERMGLQGFRYLKHTIEHRNGSHIFFRGMSTASNQALKGLENVDICWVEQAEMMSNESWEILKNSIRKPGAEIWLSFNPRNRYDVVYRDFVSKKFPGSLSIKVNYDSNKWFPAILENQRRTDLRDYPQRYAHIWLGEPDDAGELQRVLPFDRLQKCVEAYEKYAHLKPSARHAGFDPADTGANKTSLSTRAGPFLEDVQRWSLPTLGQSTRRMDGHCTETGANRVYFDAGGGYGGAVRSHVHDMGTRVYSLKPIHFGGRVEQPEVPYTYGMTNKQTFHNRYAQISWAVHLRAIQTERLLDNQPIPLYKCLFVNPEIPHLHDVMVQLAQPEWVDETGKYRIIKQPKLPGEAEPPSPDGYDSTILAFAADTRRGIVRLK